MRDEAWVVVVGQNAMHAPYTSFILVHSMFVKKACYNIPLNLATGGVNVDVCLVILHYTDEGVNLAP